MAATQTTATPVSPDRKPLDDEIDVYGLTHPGKVRTENQDHFLICALHKQMVVHSTSLPETEHLMAGGSGWPSSRWSRTAWVVGPRAPRPVGWLSRR
jgi:hypothetical protein